MIRIYRKSHFKACRLLLLAAFATLIWKPAAMAQDLGGALNLGQLGATIGVSNAMRNSVTSTPRATTTAASPAASMIYKADAARQKATVEQWLTKVGRDDPDTAKQFRQLFQQQSLSQLNGTWLKQYGMSTSNGADVAAAYLSTAWLIARGNAGDPSRAQITGLRNQLARAMAATPGWTGASNATKQEFADTLMLQGVVNSSLLTSAQNSGRSTEDVGNAVANGAESAFGVDVRQMDLTSAGFVPRS